MSFLTFKVGGHLGGIALSCIQEVYGDATLTKVHHGPSWVGGYTSLHGQVYLAVDLGKLVGFGPRTEGQSIFLAVKPTVCDRLGLLVEGPVNVAEISLVEAIPYTPPTEETKARNLIKGLYLTHLGPCFIFDLTTFGLSLGVF